MLPSLGKEFDASASTGEAAAVDDLHRTRCCRRNNGLDSEAWKARSLAQAVSRMDFDRLPRRMLSSWMPHGKREEISSHTLEHVSTSRCRSRLTDVHTARGACNAAGALGALAQNGFFCFFFFLCLRSCCSSPHGYYLPSSSTHDSPTRLTSALLWTLELPVSPTLPRPSCLAAGQPTRQVTCRPSG